MEQDRENEWAFGGGHEVSLLLAPSHGNAS